MDLTERDRDRCTISPNLKKTAMTILRDARRGDGNATLSRDYLWKKLLTQAKEEGLTDPFLNNFLNSIVRLVVASIKKYQ
jgi:hypothetical protein